MAEEVLFKFERRMDRDEIVDYLRAVADSLEAGGPLTLDAGGESVTLDPPSRPEFEIKAERETSSGGSAELSVEFELEWDEGESGENGDGGALSIE